MAEPINPSSVGYWKFPSKSLFASTARTATPTSVNQTAPCSGAHVIIDVTAVTATPSVVPTIEGYDSVSAKWYTLLTGSAITATGTTVLKIHPSIQPLANSSAQDFLPETWKLVMTHGDTDSITYSVSYNGIG